MAVRGAADWRSLPLWRLLNMFEWWFLGPDRSKEHREESQETLRAMTARYQLASSAGPGEVIDPDAPSWWHGEGEASASTSLAGARLS